MERDMPARGPRREPAEKTFWLDGRVVEPAEARISVLDHGLLYGDGVFEGIRVYGGRVFRLADHLRRIATGAASIGLEIPGGRGLLEKAVLETAAAHGAREAYIRLIVTRGEGELGVDPLPCTSPSVICIGSQIALFDAGKLARGLDMVTVSQRRPAPDALDPAVKSLNYLNSVLAKREAKLRGADEALILNAAGHVAEASVANVFVVRSGGLLTPPVSDGSLPGITRASVIEIARGLAIPVREATLGRVDLLGADEVFLTGTGARIVSVATLDGQRIGPESGVRRPVTERIERAFDDFVLQHDTPF